MTKARAENWAAPRDFSRTGFFTDQIFWRRSRPLRRNFFPMGNDNTGAFPNFNAINTGAPFDISGTAFPPQLNVDQDRIASDCGFGSGWRPTWARLQRGPAHCHRRE